MHPVACVRRSFRNLQLGFKRLQGRWFHAEEGHALGAGHLGFGDIVFPGQRGEVLDLVPDSVSASGVHAMALRTTATPAMVASRWVEYLLAAQGLAGVAWGLWVLGSRRRGGTMDVGSAAPVPVRS